MSFFFPLKHFVKTGTKVLLHPMDTLPGAPIARIADLHFQFPRSELSVFLHMIKVRLSSKDKNVDIVLF